MGIESIIRKASSAQITTASALGPAVRRVRREPEFVSVAEQAPESSLRRLEAMLAASCSKDQGTQIGLMKLRGEINEAQHSACEWFAKLHALYLIAIDSKGVKSSSAELVSKSEPPDPFSGVGRAKAKRERQDIVDFESARLVGLACGGEEFYAFMRVAVDDQVPILFMKKAVGKVSEALRRHRAAASRFRRGRR